MRKATKKYIIAWNHPQALHFAREIMQWKRDEWVYVNSAEMLKGLRDIAVYDLHAPRYTPVQTAAVRRSEIMTELRIMDSAGRVSEIFEVKLP